MEKVERVARFDLGLAIAVVYAGATTAIELWIIGAYRVELIYLVFAAAGAAAAWGGVFAWKRRRWLLAAFGFFLSLAQPVGYFVEISGPLAIALTIVSLIRGIRVGGARRRAKRAVPGPGR
jgi:hypothetical protein